MGLVNTCKHKAFRSPTFPHTVNGCQLESPSTATWRLAVLGILSKVTSMKDFPASCRLRSSMLDPLRHLNSPHVTQTPFSIMQKSPIRSTIYAFFKQGFTQWHKDGYPKPPGDRGLDWRYREWS